jgi:hypothetical protein
MSSGRVGHVHMGAPDLAAEFQRVPAAVITRLSMIE